MGLSAATIAEMKAGMQQVAAAGGMEVTNEYMDAMIRTGVRAKWLRDREREGKIKIERVMRRHTSEKTANEVPVYEVHVGNTTFVDDNACLTGCWPSEILMAQVLLALDAGLGPATDEIPAELVASFSHWGLLPRTLRHEIDQGGNTLHRTAAEASGALPRLHHVPVAGVLYRGAR